MYAEEAWVQVQPQIILNSDYFPVYSSVSYDYGLSDFHNLVFTILESKFTKPETRTLICHNFATFNRNPFKVKASNTLEKVLRDSIVVFSCRND